MRFEIKTVMLGSIAAIGCLAAFPQAAHSQSNLSPAPVITNRPPLVGTPFFALPLGSVHPRGWLLKQCQLQRDGLTGAAERIYSADLGTNSGWLGGSGESWERGPYFYKGLIALAYTLDDPGLQQKAQKWMDWLLDHQRADGYIGPATNGDWWPRMVATYALKDYYEATADPRVPTVLSNYFRFMLEMLPAHPLRDWGKARAGDEMAVALWLYNRNGDARLLDLVKLLRRQAYDWPGIFSSNAFALYGRDFHPKHNVNVEQALKMPAVFYEVSDNATDRDSVELGIGNLMRENASPPGINCGTEFLSGDASIQGVELCATVEAMLSLETAVRINGDAALADRLEMIAFNALPGGLANDIRGLQYYTLANNVVAQYGPHGFNQDYENGTLPGPNSGYPCCRCNFHMGWPKLVQNSWASSADGGLAVMAYVPSVVTARAGGQTVRIVEETAYPFEQRVRFHLSLADAARFPLVLRVPGWCGDATIQVNGEAQPRGTPGSFVRIERVWHGGDAVEADFPMPIRTFAGPENSIGINRGPLVYSLRVGENRSVHTPDPLGMGFDEFELHPAGPWNYALQLDAANPDASLTFTNFGMPANPFDPARRSVALLAKGRRLPEWTVGWRSTHAFEPPASPVASEEPLEDLILVPFGSEHLRVSWFPWLGTPAPLAGSFHEDFDELWSRRWTVFGGNWSARDHTLRTVPASANGAKALAMATAFTNLTYEGDVSVGSVGNAGLIFRASKPDIGSDAYCGYYAGINPQGSRLEFGYASNGWHAITNVPADFAPNTVCHLKIRAIGSHFQVFASGRAAPMVDIHDTNFTGGMVGVRDYCPDENRSISSFANLTVTEIRE